MKKRRIKRKLRLRKDTLMTLDHNTVGGVHGASGQPWCGMTENEACVATTLAPTCVHPHNTDVGCNETFTCTATCGLACSNGCTLG